MPKPSLCLWKTIPEIFCMHAFLCRQYISAYCIYQNLALPYLSKHHINPSVCHHGNKAPYWWPKKSWTIIPKCAWLKKKEKSKLTLCELQRHHVQRMAENGQLTISYVAFLFVWNKTYCKNNPQIRSSLTHIFLLHFFENSILKMGIFFRRSYMFCGTYLSPRVERWNE